MRVSTQFPVAVHALMMVANFPEIRITSDIVAESTGCNAVIIRNIFSKLKKAGLLSVKPGKGKTALAKSPAEISLWDVYAAVETELTEEIFKFHANTSGQCPIGGNIRDLLFTHLDSAVNAMKAEMTKVTLADLKHSLLTAQKDCANRSK